VTVWTLVSRVTGLARVVAIGAVLGPTFFGNVFQSTNMLPNLAYEFLTGSLFASLLVPPLVRALDKSDLRGAERLASGFLGVVLVGFALLATAVVLLAPLVLGLLTVGVPDPEVAAQQRRVGAVLLLLVMPQLLLYGLAGTAAAAMNARGRFALAAAAPALENVGLICTLAVSAAVWGVGRDVGDVATAQLVVLGAGATGSVALHAGAQWYGAHRAGITLRPRAGWRDPEVRQVLRAGRATLGHSGLNAARVLLVVVVANSVAGGVVAFDLAVNFVNVVIALSAKPISTALLPRLSRLATTDLRSFRTELDRATTVMACIVLPAALCLIALAVPLAGAVTVGEMSTERGVLLVSVSLMAVALGALGDGAFVLGTSASYARGDARSPFVGMALRVAVSGTGMLLALLLADGVAVLAVLGASLAVGDLASGGYLWTRVAGRLPAADGRLATGLARALLTGAAAAGAGGLAARAALGADVADLLAVAVGGSCALAALIAAHAVLRSPELAWARHQLRGPR